MENQITIKEFFCGKVPKTEDAFAEASDRLNELGILEEIKAKISPELFTFYIGVNTIGNYKGEGWHGIISYQGSFIPYIPETLATLGLLDLKTAFEEVISVFPKFVVFSSGGSYDAINFLQNPCLKVRDERLCKYSHAERVQMSKAYHSNLDKLEKLTAPLWGYNAPNEEGWGFIINYLKAVNEIL